MQIKHKRNTEEDNHVASHHWWCCMWGSENHMWYIYTDEQTPGGEKQQERIRIITTVPNTKKQKGLWKPKEIQNKLEREQLSSVARRVDTLADSLMIWTQKSCRVAVLDVVWQRWVCELVLVSIGHTDKSLRVSARVCEPTTLIRMLIDNEIKRDVTVEFFFFFALHLQLFSV